MTRVALISTTVAAAAVLMTTPRAQGQGKDPGKIFISVDMEGITGVVQPAQLGPTGFEYSRAREWMTGEAKAAIEGARAGGATSFVLADSHGNAQNLLIDQLPDDVRIVRGFPRESNNETLSDCCNAPTGKIASLPSTVPELRTTICAGAGSP
jgi:hypothetical protein